MTLDKDKIIDWRSSGRRMARRSLYKEMVTYKCAHCGVTTLEPPKDAPKWFEEIWPRQRRELEYSLQANHKTKDLTQNEVPYVEWLCAKCHKAVDSTTEKGVSTIKTRY